MTRIDTDGPSRVPWAHISTARFPGEASPNLPKFAAGNTTSAIGRREVVALHDALDVGAMLPIATSLAIRGQLRSCSASARLVNAN